mgnify:CR=1 FL=1
MLEIVDKIPVILNALPYILQGSVVTLITVIGSLALGFCIGLPLAVLQVYGPAFIRRLIGVYVWFFRGMPILLLLFLFYFGLFEVIGLNLSTITASCLVLGMASAAYQSQIFRGAMESLPRGQLNAALALGSLLSSKLNQWTLLVGMIPGVYALSSGGLTPPINLDTHQFQEILLTAGQSLFAVALLVDLRLHVREAFWLLVLFLAQLLSPLYDAQLEALLGLPHDPLRLHFFYAKVYIVLAVVLLLRNWRKVRDLRLGFKV